MRRRGLGSLDHHGLFGLEARGGKETCGGGGRLRENTIFLPRYQQEKKNVLVGNVVSNTLGLLLRMVGAFKNLHATSQPARATGPCDGEQARPSEELGAVSARPGNAAAGLLHLRLLGVRENLFFEPLSLHNTRQRKHDVPQCAKRRSASPGLG